MSDTLQLLLDGTQAIQTSRYMSGAAMTLILYDWILVAQDEADTIWQTRWTIPKTLYYFIRLVTIPFMSVSLYDFSDQRGPLSNSFCSAWSILVTVPMWACFVSSNWLFTLRLLALYRRKRWLVWFMTIFFLVTYGVSMGTLVSTVLTYNKTVAYFEAFNACGALSVTGTFPAMFYAPAAYEAFIFALTAYQAYKDAKIFSESTSAPFLIVLYRDGLICFLVMVAVRSWNIWIFATQPIYMFGLGINIMWAINAVMSTRVYLNLVYLVKKQPLTTTAGSNAMTRPGTSIQLRAPTMLDSTFGTVTSASTIKEGDWSPIGVRRFTLEGVPEEYDMTPSFKRNDVEKGKKEKKSCWFD